MKIGRRNRPIYRLFDIDLILRTNMYDESHNEVQLLKC